MSFKTKQLGLLLGAGALMTSGCSGVSKGLTGSKPSSSLLITQKNQKDDLESLVEFNELIGQVRTVANKQLSQEQAAKLNILLDKYSNDTLEESINASGFSQKLFTRKASLTQSLVMLLKEDEVSASASVKILSEIQNSDPSFTDNEESRKIIAEVLKESYSELSEVSDEDLLTTIEAEPEKVEQSLQSAGVDTTNSSSEAANENLPECSATKVSDCLLPSTHTSVLKTELAAEAIPIGASIGGLAGTAPAVPDFCSASAETGCITTDLIPALVKSELLPSKILTGTTLLSVAGTASELASSFGTPPWNGATPPPYNPTLATNAGCPASYVLVPSSKETGVGNLKQDICVAMFPMRTKVDADDSIATTIGGSVDVALHSPVMDHTGYPWVYISINQAEAECRSLGNGYRLINNSDWQNISYLVEQVGANWQNGIVGDGGLFRGDVWDEIITDINDDYDGAPVGASVAAWGAGLERRRTSYLPNGEVIWDFVRGGEWVQPVDEYGHIVKIIYDDWNGGGNSADPFNFEFDSADAYTMTHGATSTDDTANSPPEHLLLSQEMFLPGRMTRNDTTMRYEGIADLIAEGYGQLNYKDDFQPDFGFYRGHRGLFGISAYEAKTVTGWGGNTFRCVYVP